MFGNMLETVANMEATCIQIEAIIAEKIDPKTTLGASVPPNHTVRQIRVLSPLIYEVVRLLASCEARGVTGE